MRRTIEALLLVAVIVAVTNIAGVESKRLENLDQLRKTAKGLRKTCMQKTGAPAELLDGAAQRGEFPPDPLLQCYFKCLMVLTKAMKGDEIQKDVMIRQVEIMMPVDIIEPIKTVINACYGEVTSKDGCEASWEFLKCSYHKDKELYFIP